MEVLFAAVVVAVAAFAFMNGFHDASISVGNAVATRALSPRAALLVAAVFNFVGALLGQSIAAVVVEDILDFPPETDLLLGMVLAGVVGGLIWNIVTYISALPVSSTHCLFGGLIGAGLVIGASAHPSVIFYSAIVPLLMTPLLAFLLSFIAMEIALGLVGRTAVKPLLRSSRIVMSVLTGALSLAHGIQDAQKSAAVLMVAWLAYSAAGPLNPEGLEISWPIRLTIAFALALGTLLSGWRVARTLSIRMVRLDPVKATVADLTSTAFMYVAAFILRVPVSMSFIVAAGNFGTQFTHRRPTIRIRYVLPVMGSWLVGLPAAGLIGAALAVPIGAALQ